MKKLAPRDLKWHPKAKCPDYRSTVFRSPKKNLIAIPEKLRDSSGPVFGFDCIGQLDHDLTINFSKSGRSAIGERLIVHGKIIDEGGRPIPKALIEIWQANAGGRYRHKNDQYQAPLDPNFSGCGRCVSDKYGNYFFRTIRPGAYPWPNGGNDWRPSHIHFSIFGYSFGQRLITQMYFEGDPHIKNCPIIHAIKNKKAVSQLIARLDMSNTKHMDSCAYRFDIVLRGPCNS
mgnify:CR=1 FL=1